MNTQDGAAIQSVVQRYAKAWVAGDTKAMVDLYHEDAQVRPPFS
jgi:uncharacterized protein (TIGR02246 family)